MTSPSKSGVPSVHFRPSAEQRHRTQRARKEKRSEAAWLLENYQPFPHQLTFHESPAKYRLFGGAAGPGKTKALLWEAIYQAHRVPGSDSLLLRRTYPELESSLLAQFRRDVPRTAYKKFNESKYVVTWKNGSVTRFGYCRNENDVYRYQGAELLFIGIDELTHFTLKQWQFLTSRNRCPIKHFRDFDGIVRSVKPCMAGATNPGNIGHAWVKALWVDKTPPPGFEQAGLYDPRDYDFIRARLADNPIYANDAEYRKSLEVLPEHLRKAFLEGDWNVFAGQYFDIFDYGRHTARPEEMRLEPWYPRWISIDWGFQHNSAVYWHCAVPPEASRISWPVSREERFSRPGSFRAHNSQLTADSQNSESGSAVNAVSCQLSAVSPQDSSEGFHGTRTDHGTRIITYREFVQNGLSPRMLAQAIAERSGRENISEVFLSPDAFAHRTAESSIAEQLGDVLVANGLPRPAPADDDRIGGWQFMYQLLESDTWLITENCDKLIACLPTLVRDNSNVEDIRKMDGDDPADAARYGLVSGGRFAGVGAGFIQPTATYGSPHFGPEGAGAQSFPGAGPDARFSAPLQRQLSAAELEALRTRRSSYAEGSTAGARFSASPHGAAVRDPGVPRFVTGMPLDEQIKRHISATDPTSRAIHSQRLEAAAQKHFRPKPLPRRRR
jgi:Terminase large subunit, T4likevirus-type, N-terminal